MTRTYIYLAIAIVGIIFSAQELRKTYLARKNGSNKSYTAPAFYFAVFLAILADKITIILTGGDSLLRF